MYLEHFGLAVNPFSLSPKLDFLYKSGTFEESMAHLIYGLDNQEAIVLITGTIGTGKTMAIQSFLSNLGPRFEFALITNTRVTGTELLKLILEDLDVSLPAGADKSDLLILFKDFLHEAHRNGKHVLLVVDEAQNLAPEVLEEIRLLTNLGQGDVQPVQIILVGQPELEETVNRPDLAQIRQRIRVHYNLDPMNRQETEEYLDHRMAVAGCTRRAFSSGAIDRIFQGSRGIPRLVNTLAGEALLSAFVAERDMVQPQDVDLDGDLRYATGKAPERAAAPTAAPPPAAPPAEPARPPQPEAVSIEQAMDRLEPVQAPPPRAARSAREVPRRRKGNPLPWTLAAALVVFGTLYLFGYLDGVLEGAKVRWDDLTGQPEVRTAMSAEPVEARPADEGAPVETGAKAATVDSVPSGSDKPLRDDEVDRAGPAASETEVIPPAAATAAENPSSPPAREEPTSRPETREAGFFIHIYSFRTPERADSLVRRWDNPEDSISIVKQEVRGVDWYRVYLGPYPSREAALMVALQLEQDGSIDYYKVIKNS